MKSQLVSSVSVSFRTETAFSVKKKEIGKPLRNANPTYLWSVHESDGGDVAVAQAKKEDERRVPQVALDDHLKND